MTDPPPRLTWALRNLLWSLQSELDVVNGLSRQIDAHVRAVNRARAELVQRLERLEALVVATDDPHLSAFLRERAVVALPVEDEVVPPGLDRSRA